VINFKNMREWLNVDGFRASGTRPWFARVEVGCVNGQFQFTQDFAQPPRIGEGAPQFALHPFIEFVVESEHPDEERAWDPVDFDQMIAHLSSEDFIERFSASAQLQASIRRGAITPTQRREMIPKLLKIAALESKRLDWPTPEQEAMSVLGQLEAWEAIPVLVRRITDRFFDGFMPDHHTHASIALAKIGEPAVAPLIERVAVSSNEEWRYIQSALYDIDRKSPLVRQVMETLLDAQDLLPPAADDEEKAERELIEKRLTEFLKTPGPKRPKPQPGPEARIHTGPGPESSLTLNR